jgi:beta-phosphoglucomutase-like phosphatase (HAD superfamily)
MAPRAVVFDFNGTLSDDEPILYCIFAELFAERGKPLTEREYYDQLVGRSDPEIVRLWLGSDHPDVDSVITERVNRYRAAVSDGSTISPAVRESVRYAAERVAVGIVSGAARAEIEPVVAAAGLAPLFGFIVSAEDVVEGKPDPEGYLRALDLLDDGLQPEQVVVFEDTEAGVASAKSAGMRCVGLTRTLGAARLAQADELVPGLEPAVVHRLLA